MPSVGVLILAGGEATRFPGKLELDASGVPLVARVFRNVSPKRETWLAVKGALPPEVDALLPAPMAVDRWSMRGPLAGMVTTMAQMRARWVFAVAGDAPWIDSAFIDELAAQRRSGDEAVVPAHEDGGARTLQPLAALYDRLAFLREGFPMLRAGSGSLHAMAERLRTRYVTVNDASVFANLNTPADYERYLKSARLDGRT